MKKRRQRYIAARKAANDAKIFTCKENLEICPYFKEGQCKIDGDILCANRRRGDFTGYVSGVWVPPVDK